MATVAEIQRLKQLQQALKEREQKIAWELEQAEKDGGNVDPTKSLTELKAQLELMEYEWDEKYQKFLKDYHAQLDLPPEDD